MNHNIRKHLCCLKKKISNGYVKKKRDEIKILRGDICDEDDYGDEDDELNTGFYGPIDIKMFCSVMEARMELLLDGLGKLKN